MSLSCGGILWKTNLLLTAERLLETLALTPFAPLGQVTLHDASRGGFAHTAVGAYQGCTVLIDHRLPYDLPMQSEEHTLLGWCLEALSREGPLLAFSLDDTSGTVGLWVYRDGTQARMRISDPRGVLAEQGPPLPEEQARGEAGILALTGRWLGRPLDELIFFEAVPMEAFRVHREVA